MSDDTSTGAPMEIAHIRPLPSPEEVAAIVAAIEGVWPRPQAALVPDPPMRWRFSGRWWSKPVPARRDRPT